MTDPLQGFCTWLAATPVSEAIQNISWIIPLTQTVHILAIGVVLASAAMVDLRLFGLAGRSEPMADVARRLLPWIWGGLPVLLLSGLILITGEPSRELQNATFVKKMILLAAAIGVTALLQVSLRRDAEFWIASPGRRLSAKVMALLSIALWIAVIFAGRLIAYTDHP